MTQSIGGAILSSAINVTQNSLQHGWNAFRNKDPVTAVATGFTSPNYGVMSMSRPDRFRYSSGVDRTFVTAIYNRIAVDCTKAHFEHVRTDDSGRFSDMIKDSSLSYIFKYEANIDQTSTAFFRDIVQSMLDEGVVAVAPIDTDTDPDVTGSFKINSMRTGHIEGWYPSQVRLEVYDERIGRKMPLIMDKNNVAIIENPFYSVMNESNSTLQRLIRKLQLLDTVDEESNSGKLDLIIKLPYLVKSQARQQQAELRKQLLEEQLTQSRYGIGYIDGTEDVIQLNRSVENNLLNQIEQLTNTLYSQLGITAEIMNGTADEKAMTNYYTRTIDPILDAIREEFERKFLTKTARTQGQAIMYFRDPFALASTDELAEAADKFCRNEITSSNDIRSAIGMKPVKGQGADELRNSNMPVSDQAGGTLTDAETGEEAYDVLGSTMDGLSDNE